MKSKKMIYFIDDDEKILKLLGDCVQCAEGVSISYRTFNSAIDCLMQLENDRAKENLPNYVYTDLNMPGMDGLELISQLDRLFPSVKVGVISSEPELLPSAAKQQVEVWKKPFHLINFVERLQSF